MHDERRKQLLEQYEDAAMALLMDEYAEEEGARLLREFEAVELNGEFPSIPTDLDEKCRKLIDCTFARKEREARLKRIGKSVTKAAVFLFVFLGLSAATVFSVEAFRTPFLNFLLDKSERFTTVGFKDGIDIPQQASDILTELEACLPDGYQEVVKLVKQDGTFTAFYQDADGHLISFESTLSANIKNVDTEDAKVEKVLVNGSVEVMLIEKDGYRAIWTDNTYDLIFDFYADDLQKDVFWKMTNQLIT